MSSQLNLLQQYDRIIGGLQILAKYGEQSTSAEHDVIYAGPSFWQDANARCSSLGYVSDEDKVALESFGWHWSYNANSWGFFT
jgi:hypothetical protein